MSLSIAGAVCSAVAVVVAPVAIERGGRAGLCEGDEACVCDVKRSRPAAESDLIGLPCRCVGGGGRLAVEGRPSRAPPAASLRSSSSDLDISYDVRGVFSAASCPSATAIVSKRDCREMDDASVVLPPSPLPPAPAPIVPRTDEGAYSAPAVVMLGRTERPGAAGSAAPVMMRRLNDSTSSAGLPRAALCPSAFDAECALFGSSRPFFSGAFAGERNGFRFSFLGAASAAVPLVTISVPPLGSSF
jgi:hypothetical protein